MKSKFLKHLFQTLLVSALPTFLSYLTSIVGDAINIPVVQDYCLWIGILLSAILLSGQLLFVKIKYDCTLEERNLLIRMSKDILSGTLGKLCFSNQPNFDVRIFIPKWPILYSLAERIRFLNIKRKFIIKNIDLIAEQGTTKDLEFEVFPSQEGLVGLCYQSKSMVFDDDLEHSNSTD